MHRRILNPCPPRRRGRPLAARLALLGAGLLIAACGDPEPVEIPVYEDAACRFALAGDQVEGQTVSCGDLLVPENRDVPEGPELRIHFARFHSEVDGAPTVLLTGGPGSASTTLVEAVDAQMAQTLTATGDFIFFDQRGVGASMPTLDCPEVLSFFQPLDDPSAYGAAYAAAVSPCAQRLTEEGHDLTAYNTQANADDVEDLRLALELDQVNLVGVSYGARLALEIMRRHPDGLRAVVLDAVPAPQFVWPYEAGANFEDALFRLFDACAADTGCSNAYGDLEVKVVEAIAAMNASPLVLPNLQVPLPGNDFSVLLINFLYQRLTYANIPAIVDAAHRGDAAAFEGLYLQMLAAFPDPGEPPAFGMQFSMLCHGAVRYADEQELMDAYTDVTPELGAAIKATFSDTLYELCADWPVGPADASLLTPVSSAVPTLVLNGEYDPVTPMRYGHEAADTLSQSFVVDFPDSGHGISIGSPCGLDVRQAFLQDPTVQPDTSCVDSLAFDFALPAPTP